MRPRRLSLRQSRRFAWILCAPFLLVSCAGLSPAAPQESARSAAGPASFALAVQRGLPVTVGVYGVVSGLPLDADEPESSLPGSRLEADVSVLPAAGRSGDTGPNANGAENGADNGDEEGESINIGAGFLIDADGLIATAAHVVSDASKIVVKLTDQRVFAAELVGKDVESDVALIRIPVSLPFTPRIGQSALLEAGDWVIAIGDPYGLTRSVAAGIVGGGARHFAEDRDALFIQSDLALNPGNSGGPLLDTSGAIVGMNLRMMIGPFGTAGVSLSMPIELVLQIVRDLKDGGVNPRPRLGAQFEDVSPPAALAAGRLLADGALVTSVSAGSVAARIGLLVDDIVVGFNGRPLSDSADLVKALLSWQTEAGTRIIVYRDGDYRRLALE